MEDKAGPSSIKPKTTNRRKLSFEDKVSYARTKKVKRTQHPKIFTEKSSQTIYEMSQDIRGRCAIFANSKYVHLQPHLGYIADAEILESVFKQLNFYVTVYKNRGAKFIKSRLKKLSCTPVRGLINNADQPDAFVAIILGHGNKSKLMGVKFKSETETPKEVLRESDIVNILNNENCPYLREKPKLVFIQACQGEKEDHGVSFGNGNLADEDEGIQDDMEEMAHPAFTPSSSTSLENGDNPDEVKKIPTESDMMICYSTVAGYRSFVKPTGSIFGIALATALINHAHNTDVQSLLNKVSYQMSEETTPVYGGHAKQIPEITYKGWTRKLYFNPGYTKSQELKKREARSKSLKLINKTEKVKPLKRGIVAKTVSGGNKAETPKIAKIRPRKQFINSVPTKVNDTIQEQESNGFGNTEQLDIQSTEESTMTMTEEGNSGPGGESSHDEIPAERTETEPVEINNTPCHCVQCCPTCPQIHPQIFLNYLNAFHRRDGCFCVMCNSEPL